MQESKTYAPHWNQILEPCVNVALRLSPGDLVVVHIADGLGRLLSSRAAARNAKKHLHGSCDLGCINILEQCRNSREAHIALANFQPAAFSLLLPLRRKEQFLGALQFVSDGEPARLMENLADLRECANWIAQSIAQHHDSLRLRARMQGEFEAYKLLEERLTMSAHAAAEANQAKSQFLAGISHEIRTPLGVIQGFADLALDSQNLSSETRGYITSIRRNAEQVTRIVGEVLDLAKIEASHLEIEEMSFPLMPVLNDVIASLDVPAREKSLVLALECEHPLPRMIRTDPTRLRQILTNLIGNAIKFTASGRVALHVRLTSKPVEGTPVQLEFAVRDTGIGISNEVKERLFQPFSQGEASTSRRFGGTGLGLALSRQLVRALGGDLDLRESRVGEGSTFAFCLSGGPFTGVATESTLAADVAPPPQTAVSSLNSTLKGKKVLLIEDSEDNQVLISRYLTSAGLSVAIASNGLDGLERLAREDFDLVVLDIQMPGMDGHEVARRLRGNGFERPIIALTAHAFKEDRDRAFDSGFTEYLTKPINRGILLKTLGDRLTVH